MTLVGEGHGTWVAGQPSGVTGLFHRALNLGAAVEGGLP